MTGRGGARSDPGSGSDSFHVPDPGFDDSDERQIVYRLLGACGLSVVMWGPVGPDELLDEALRVSPVLEQAEPHGPLLNITRSGMQWTMVTGPRGSALVLFIEPEADFQLLITGIVDPFKQARAPIKSDMVMAEAEASAELAAFLGQPYLVVAPWECGRLQYLAAGSRRIPWWVRTALVEWEQVTATLYRRELVDSDGDRVTVHLRDLRGDLWFYYPVGQSQTSDLEAWKWVEELTEFRLEWLEPTVCVTSRFIPSNDPTSDAQELIDQFAAAYHKQRTVGDVQPLPAPPVQGPWLQRIDTATAPPGRAFQMPALAADEYLIVDRVRHAVDGDTFEDVNAAAQRVLRQRGTGFEYSWRQGVDLSSVTPPWLSIYDAVLDQPAGVVVAVGGITHRALGLAPAYDLGAIDGRNGFSFPSAGHTDGVVWPSKQLYVGSVKSGALLPLSYVENIQGVDYHAASGSIAVTESLGGSSGALTVRDRNGDRRLLTVLSGIGGYESPRFSADGRWILVDTSPLSTLVEVETGQSLQSPEIVNASWWPLEGSVLLVLRQDEAKETTPVLYDLRRGRDVHTFPMIRVSPPPLSEYRYHSNHGVSKDGRYALIGTTSGVTPDFQHEHGTGKRIATLDLTTGYAVVRAVTFLDETQLLELDVRGARWISRAEQTSPTLLHPDLRTLLQPAQIEHEYLSLSRWASEAASILQLTLNRAIQHYEDGEDPGWVMPEVVGSMLAASRDPDLWARGREWFGNVARVARVQIQSGRIAGESVRSWNWFTSAFAVADAGQPESIDPLKPF